MTRSRRGRPATLLAIAGLCAALAAEVAAQESTALDRSALEALYDATGGANWTDNTNWKTSAPLGEWEGVTIDAAGRVTELYLYNHGLTGQLPAELGSLSKLRRLNFGVNRGLTGPIPPELGQLVNLESVGLWECDLTGQLPSTLGNLVNLEDLSLDQNRLTGPIPPELGRLANLKVLSLRQTGVTGPLPIELGSLENLEWLNLSWNALTGPIPASLGNLVNLEHLILNHNDLSGVLPSTLTNLSNLVFFDVSETDACVPSDAAFQQWRAAIEARGGEFSGESCDSHAGDRVVLEAFYDATGGANWADSTNWKTSARLRDWYGVTTDDDGRVTHLVLYANGLEGEIPASLGNLVSLEHLVLNNNGLSGSLPVALTNLEKLVTFDVSATEVCIPSDPAFREWRAAIEGRGGTFSGSGVPCEDHAGDRAVLEALYDSTGGANWTDSTNWKTTAPLRDWYGVTTDGAGRVTGLGLFENELTGLIPVALRDLTNLEELWLTDNALTGPIPRELGSLANLEELLLNDNGLTGPIPRELGGLANLELLFLSDNALTGPIPRELGSLANLRRLGLWDNGLTGPIPHELGNLTDLEWLLLNDNGLTGPIPRELGGLTNLEWLMLQRNALDGPIPHELGNLTNLELVNFHGNWGLSGALPSGVRLSRLRVLDIFMTQACAPSDWRNWLKSFREFRGRLCGSDADVIDIAVLYTPAVRDEVGGAANIAALIDLMVAETNQAYATSGVHHRLALVERSEVPYVESGDSGVDLDRLVALSDGHMDEVHVLRDRVGADLVHLIIDVHPLDIGGRAVLNGAFAVTAHHRGARVFVHELGHNMGLRHDRYEEHKYMTSGGADAADPAYGYVNQRAFEAGAPESSRWQTIMAYPTQCQVAGGFHCPLLFRFSNPRQNYQGDPLGVAYGSGESGLTGPADAAAVLNATGPAVALWRDPPSANLPPVTVGALMSLVIGVDQTPVTVEVSGAFRDPEGDRLAYGASSSEPRVATVVLSGSRVTVAPVSVGTAAVTVTATDIGGSNTSATQRFGVTVTAPGSFVDDRLVPGVTPIKAIHFTELRARIDVVRSAVGLAPFSWTDPVLVAGVTRVRRVHLLELRSALAEAYRAAGRAAPRWTDASLPAGSTPIRAVHVTELRAAVLALE